MSRRKPHLLALGLAAIAAAFAGSRVPEWSREAVERRLSAYFHRPVHVGAVRYQLVPFTVEALDVRVGGAAPGAPPFITLSRVIAAPSLRQLWDGRIVLTHLRVENPSIHVNAFANGGDDIPALGDERPGREVRIRRLVIAGGELFLDHRRIPLDLDLPGFRGRLSQRRLGVLAGSVGFGPGTARFSQAAPLPVSMDADLVWDGRTIVVERARLTAEGSELRGRGQIHVRPRLAAEMAMEGPVDLAVLDKSIVQSGLSLAGDAYYRGTVSLSGGRLRLRGKVTGLQGLVGEVAVPRFAGDLSFDEKGLRLSALEASLLGGRARLEVTVPAAGQGPARVNGRLFSVDAEAAAAAVFDIGRPGVGAAATGDIELGWPRSRPREVSGRLALELAPLADARTPLSGQVTWSAREGHQRVEDVQLRYPEGDARLAGTIDISRRVDLALTATSRDIAGSEALLRRLRLALGARDPVPSGFSGAGRFAGRWRGSLDAPIFEGRVTADDLSYLGVRWGHAEWAGTATPEEVRSHSLVLRRAKAELWLDGRLDTGALGAKDALDLRLRLREWPAADLNTALEWDVALEGALTGSVAVSGRRSAPEGTAELQSSAGRYYGVPYEALKLTARFGLGTTAVSAGEARVGGGALSFRGTLTEQGLYDGEAELRDLELGALFPDVRAAVRPGGRVSGTVVLQGPLARPRLEGVLRSTRLFLGDEGVGALEARLFSDGDGRVAVDARAHSPRVDARLTGDIALRAPFPADLRLGLRDTSVDPFLRAVAPLLPATLAVLTTGDLQISGPLQDPAALRARAEIPELNVLLPEYAMRNTEPLLMDLAEGRVSVREVHMAGEGTDLTVTGSAAVLAEGPLDLEVSGAADLRALSAVTRELRGRGAARVALQIAGTRALPDLQGTLDLDGAGMRVRGFPHGIDDVRGKVRFSGRSAHFASVTGTIGGGAVELEGQAAYAKGALGSFDIRGTGQGLVLRYPEGLRSVVDADLRFFGSATEQWLTGEVEVRQAAWTRRYDVASELLAPTAAGTPTAALPRGVRYDVKIQAPGTLRLDNNLAALQARADLRLQGTHGAPVILGRAEIERGRVYFQGNTYVIRRGAIDFANPQKVDPLFDIEAETRVRSYGVTLKVNGTLERVYPTLTSDPPLSTVQILSLLAGQDETEVVSLVQVQTGQNRLAAAGAATLAAGRLSEEVGLERGAARLGLSRFSIDPSVVRGGTAATARLTAGKRITPDLNVVYSQNVSGTEERLFAVEYTVSDRLSVLLTRAEPGGFGFDLRVRRTR